MSSLADTIKNNWSKIKKHLYIGYANQDDLVDRIRECEKLEENKEMIDEQVWTFLLGCGYAATELEGVKKLSKLLTGTDMNVDYGSKIWFEVLPIPPREKEGNTHLDLAVGTISLRSGTSSGIKLSDEDHTWICFCEMKWNSDISTTVSYDLKRNQLIRVIENAICFQNDRKYADQVFVTLVTPAMFYRSDIKSRLYQYKFEEYNNKPDNIYNELKRCKLVENHYENWYYPEYLKKHINNLKLNWITFEDLFEKIPSSPVEEKIKSFWDDYGKDL